MGVGSWRVLADSLYDQLAEKDAEIERLREALRNIEALSPSQESNAWRIARAALGEKK